jgi:hypothetical protein
MQIPGRQAGGRSANQRLLHMQQKKAQLLAKWPPRRGQAQRKRRLIGGGAQHSLVALIRAERSAGVIRSGEGGRHRRRATLERARR